MVAAAAARLGARRTSWSAALLTCAKVHKEVESDDHLQGRWQRREVGRDPLAGGAAPWPRMQTAPHAAGTLQTPGRSLRAPPALGQAQLRPPPPPPPASAAAPRPSAALSPPGAQRSRGRAHLRSVVAKEADHELALRVQDARQAAHREDVVDDGQVEDEAHRRPAGGTGG
jgi:hypothetical protein